MTEVRFYARTMGLSTASMHGTVKLTTEFHLEWAELHHDTRQVLSVRSTSAQKHCYLSTSTEPKITGS
jgi:hypothetical protein